MGRAVRIYRGPSEDEGGSEGDEEKSNDGMMNLGVRGRGGRI